MHNQQTATPAIALAISSTLSQIQTAAEWLAAHSYPNLDYAARDGGNFFKPAAIGHMQTGLNQLISAAGEQRLFRLFSLRHEFSAVRAALPPDSQGSVDAFLEPIRKMPEAFVPQSNKRPVAQIPNTIGLTLPSELGRLGTD